MLSHSIMKRARRPVEIIPLIKEQLPEFTRTDTGSTDFAYTRFLVPYLSGYTGFSLFMDSDMLCLCDIESTLEHIDITKAVSVVKHDYKTTASVKFLGALNEDYPRKNWSSLMLFNNAKCDKLTVKSVNNSSPAWLHRFGWVNDEHIGELPIEFNHLVGEYAPNPEAKIVHYTLGTPCFSDYEECEYADEWRRERGEMLHADGGEREKTPDHRKSFFSFR